MDEQERGGSLGKTKKSMVETRPPDEDTLVSPSKKVKLDHDFKRNENSQPVKYERRKGEAPVKQE